jgi:LAO/AO transport system kinase
MAIDLPPGRKVDPILLERVLAGDFRSVARLITAVENGAPEAASYLRELFPKTGRCFTIGITGAPGAGKSTLVDRIAGYYRGRGKRVGIVAVDPSSPFSGGAILGDRIRMQSHSLDPGTFIRSMATRGNLGGLAAATGDVVMVLDAAGFQVVVVETVGVGQDEVEVASAADVTVLLLVPGMGDDVQAMKAGIMEIGDIFVINKADHSGADRLETELKSLLATAPRSDGWKRPVVRTIASEGQGVEACMSAIEEYREFISESEFRSERLVQIQKNRLLDVARSMILHQLYRSGTAEGELDSLARRIVNRQIDPFTAAEEFLRPWLTVSRNIPE